MSKAKLAFGNLAKRITGVSLPVFGVSWNPPVPERDIVRAVFVFLEDRRALYNPFDFEEGPHVAQSVLAIRAEMTGALKRLPESSEASSSLRAIRAACREYLDVTQQRGRRWGPPFEFSVALGRLRAIVGVQVSYLAVKHGIDIEGELLQVIPAEFRDASFLEE